MRDIAHGILHGLVVAAILLGFAAWAPAQPYAITSGDPLVIEKLLDAGDDTAAFLTNAGTDNGIEYHGRTNATRSGFDFTCTSDGGQGWTGLVYRDDDVTYRAAISAGQFGDPEFYEADWNSIEVYDDTIEPTPGTTGYDPECGAAVGLSSPTDPIPLSYLLKQMQHGLVRQMVGFTTLLISEHDAGAWTVDSDSWAPDKMVFDALRRAGMGSCRVSALGLGPRPDG